MTVLDAHGAGKPIMEASVRGAHRPRPSLLRHGAAHQGRLGRPRPESCNPRHKVQGRTGGQERGQAGHSSINHSINQSFHQSINAGKKQIYKKAIIMRNAFGQSMKCLLKYLTMPHKPQEQPDPNNHITTFPSQPRHHITRHLSFPQSYQSGTVAPKT